MSDSKSKAGSPPPKAGAATPARAVAPAPKAAAAPAKAVQDKLAGNVPQKTAGAGNAKVAKVPAAKAPAIAGAPQLTPLLWAATTRQFDLVEIARKRRIGFLFRFLGFVGLPTLLAAVYVFLYASPRYVSEFQIAYQSNNPAQSVGSSMLTSFLGATTSANMNEVVGTYFASDAVLTALEPKLQLKSYFSDKNIDWLDRLPADASREKFLKYFNKRLTVTEESGGYLIVDIEAFDPPHAKAIAEAMVSASDKMVSEAFDRPRKDSMDFAEAEVNRMLQRLSKATYDVTKFQNDHHELDVTAAAGHIDATVGTLQTQLSETRSELINARTVLADSSPTVTALRSKISALEQQIVAEQVRLASGTANTPFTNAAGTDQPSPAGQSNGATAASQSANSYSNITAEYAALVQLEKYAEASYVTAKQAYDLARADAVHKQDYIISFVPPNLPQESTSPDPLEYILGTFLLSLFVYGAGSVLYGAFKDQAGV